MSQVSVDLAPLERSRLPVEKKTYCTDGYQTLGNEGPMGSGESGIDL